MKNDYYFYCPNCNYENIVDTIPKGTIGNTRGGYGTPIRHFECPNCFNLDAGYMQFNIGRMGELPINNQKKYFQKVITEYQGIRGFSNKHKL